MTTAQLPWSLGAVLALWSTEDFGSLSKQWTEWQWVIKDSFFIAWYNIVKKQVVFIAKNKSGVKFLSCGIQFVLFWFVDLFQVVVGNWFTPRQLSNCYVWISFHQKFINLRMPSLTLIVSQANDYLEIFGATVQLSTFLAPYLVDISDDLHSTSIEIQSRK